MAERRALETSLKNLHINPSRSAKKTQPISDSWEDEELEDSGDDTDRPGSSQQPTDYPSAPPPTPISPTSSFPQEVFISPYGSSIGGNTDSRAERVRPEKTDAVAKRMIAGALGVRAPKKTEEQKAYDRAVKEKEIKRRNQEKEAAAKVRAESERAKAAVWED